LQWQNNGISKEEINNMSDLRKMEGKRVVVTGSGTGVGRGIGLEFAKAGAAVVFHYSHNVAGAESAVQEILDAGGKATAVNADFNEVEEARKLGKEAIEFLGGVDVLINNAGITVNIPFLKVRPEQYDTLYNVNCRSPYFLLQTITPTMAEQGGGVVINVSSGHAFAGFREHSIYAGTKAAILGYTRTLSLELAPMGIRANTLALGWVRVENQEKLLGDDFDWEEGGKLLPAGFVATPSDIGKCAVALASDDCKYIYGQTIICDGGQLSLLPLTPNFREPVNEQYGQGYVPGI
jgi:NAD(P)-dependent dehydrogenase (short-subunit alcohol dehydrogenase family)